MKCFPLTLLGLLAAAFLPACTTTTMGDPDLQSTRPYVPRVTMPVELNANEQNLLGDVEHVLEQNGLRPTDRSGVDYQLTFSVEDGPVNADVTLTLYQGRNRVANAYARVGGPRIVFQRQRVIREAFDKALQQFEGQLPRINSGGGGGGGGRYESDRYDSQPYQPQPNAPYSQPSPYGQPNPYGQPSSYGSGY